MTGNQPESPPPHVLVIEDDEDLRDLFATMEGFSVDTADNGLVGLAKLRARRPSIIVSDLMMPIMSGWEFSAAAAGRPIDVAVVCVSAVTELEHVGRDLRVRAGPVETALGESSPYGVQKGQRPVRLRHYGDQR